MYFKRSLKKDESIKTARSKEAIDSVVSKELILFSLQSVLIFICFFILISISFVKGKEYQMQYFICFFIRVFFFQFLVFSFPFPRLLIFLYSPILEKMVNNE